MATMLTHLSPSKHFPWRCWSKSHQRGSDPDMYVRRTTRRQLRIVSVTGKKWRMTTFFLESLPSFSCFSMEAKSSNEGRISWMTCSDYCDSAIVSLVQEILSLIEINRVQSTEAQSEEAPAVACTLSQVNRVSHLSQPSFPSLWCRWIGNRLVCEMIAGHRKSFYRPNVHSSCLHDIPEVECVQRIPETID